MIAKSICEQIVVPIACGSLSRCGPEVVPDDGEDVIFNTDPDVTFNTDPDVTW